MEQVPRVNPIANGAPMRAPSGIVYSTSPRLFECDDGETYVIKFPGLPGVIAECVCHMLAKQIEVPVPDFAITLSHQGEWGFCSRYRSDAIRDALPFLRGHRHQTLMLQMSDIMALDVWVGNVDRNLGNLLVGGRDGENVLIAIDFEKAVAVTQEHPTADLMMRQDREFWPSELLGQICNGAPFPRHLALIAQNAARWTSAILDTMAQSFGLEYHWRSATEHVLLSRADGLQQICEQLWKR